MSSVNVKIANKMKRRLAPYFRRLGFEQRGRVYYRINPDGIVSLATFEIWGTYEEGNFTMELSVFIPGIYHLLNNSEIPGKLENVHCPIRLRLSEIVNGHNGNWWKLNDDPNFIETFMKIFEVNALPFYNRYSSHEKILDEYDIEGEAVRHGTPPRIVAAMIYLSQGRKEDAARLLFEQAARSDGHKGHREYVLRLAHQHQLLPKLTTADFNAIPN